MSITYICITYNVYYTKSWTHFEDNLLDNIFWRGQDISFPSLRLWEQIDFARFSWRSSSSAMSEPAHLLPHHVITETCGSHTHTPIHTLIQTQKDTQNHKGQIMVTILCRSITKILTPYRLNFFGWPKICDLGPEIEAACNQQCLFHADSRT